MTFANPPAYGRGTHVRCDVCRDPEALVEARAGSEVVVQIGTLIVGTDEATAIAIRTHGFVRRGYQVLCHGCAAAAHV